MDEFSRLELLIGKEKLDKLKNSHVAIFGLGGVGSYCAEALSRSAITKFDLIDCDRVDITNINRQIIALHSTLGEFKTEVTKKRMLDINPRAQINTYQVFFDNNTVNQFDFSKYDYIVDAIDSIPSKIELIVKAKKENIRIISSMGTGNKLNPQDFLVEDIYKTTTCPLARVMRSELKKRQIKDLLVVYSKEIPIKIENQKGKIIPASSAFCPGVAGLILASVVVNDIIKT